MFGYKFTTTGHSLGGQVSKYVNNQNKEKVHKNITFSQGSSLFDAFVLNSRTQWMYHTRTIGLVLGQGYMGNQYVDTRQQMNSLKVHNLQTLYV